MNINMHVPKWEDSWPVDADLYGRVYHPITPELVAFMTAIGDKIFRISKNEAMPAAYRTRESAYIIPGNQLVYDTRTVIAGRIRVVVPKEEYPQWKIMVDCHPHETMAAWSPLGFNMESSGRRIKRSTAYTWWCVLLHAWAPAVMLRGLKKSKIRNMYHVENAYQVCKQGKAPEYIPRDVSLACYLEYKRRLVAILRRWICKDVANMIAQLCC